MNLRTITIAVALALLAAFTMLNWNAFNTPTTLSLGFAEVQAPLGLAMLVFAGLLTALFLIYLVFQQASVIAESRRYAKELKSQRELADTAEASRFTELRAFLDGELRRIEAQGAAATRELGARVDRIETSLNGKVAESTHSLAAYLGEIDGKLERLLAPPRPD